MENLGSLEIGFPTQENEFESPWFVPRRTARLLPARGNEACFMNPKSVPSAYKVYTHVGRGSRRDTRGSLTRTKRGGLLSFRESLVSLASLGLCADQHLSDVLSLQHVDERTRNS